jgi:hypothetical protein
MIKRTYLRQFIGPQKYSTRKKTIERREENGVTRHNAVQCSSQKLYSAETVLHETSVYPKNGSDMYHRKLLEPGQGDEFLRA